MDCYQKACSSSSPSSSSPIDVSLAKIKNEQIYPTADNDKILQFSLSLHRLSPGSTSMVDLTTPLDFPLG